MGQGNKEFDRNVAIQLYERMDKNGDGQVTIEEFKKVFVEAIEILHNKVETCLKYISDYKQSKDQALLKLDEVKQTENLNAHGIMEGSTLTLFILEANGLKPLDDGKTSDPFVVVECEGSTFQTAVVEQTTSPVWNESHIL